MENQPLVSVVMSVFNGEKYVADAIESILNQTYQNWEFIIINDGSRDSTESVIGKYQDSRIKYIHHDNMGLSKSLNKGIKLSSGKYIARIDADDRSLPTRIEKQVNFLEKNPEFLLVASYSYNVNLTNMIVTVSKSPVEDHACRDNLMLGSGTFLHSSVMFKKEINGEVMMYDEISKAEDALMWIKLATLGSITCLPEILCVGLRKDPSSITSNRNNWTRITLPFLLSFTAFQELHGSVLKFPIIFLKVLMNTIKTEIINFIFSLGFSDNYYKFKKSIGIKKSLNISPSEIPSLWNAKISKISNNKTSIE